MAHEEDGLIQNTQPWTDDEGDAEQSDRDLEVNSDTDGTNRAFPIPVWMRESSKSFRWRWVPLPFRKAARATAKWVKGPQPPIELSLRPIFPTVQEWPIRMMDKYVPKRRHRMALLGILYVVWFLPWMLVLRHSQKSGNVEGFGKPANIWCGYHLWYEACNGAL
jgi:hypothetical protein